MENRPLAGALLCAGAPPGLPRRRHAGDGPGLLAAAAPAGERPRGWVARLFAGLAARPGAAPAAASAEAAVVRRVALLAVLAGVGLSAPDAHADAAAGKRKAAMCQACHGMDGIGTNPTVPNIAGDSETYIISQLQAFRGGAREHEQMSIIAQSLSDEDIRNLAA